MDQTTSQIRFGSSVLDVETRRLIRDGREVHVTPKGFDLLRLLAEHAPRALTKTELVEHLWPNTFVSDDALARLISDVRVTIGDSARQPTLIRTIHGFGYAFTAEVQSESRLRPRTPFKLTWASHDFPLNEGENVIGRDPDVAVPINASIVSRRHARVTVAGGDAEIKDLGSKNGTFVANERLASARQLKDGDVIKVGDYELTFRAVANDMPTVTRQG
ncbi:MAG: FHA domain-containing protein [Acidobacteria bacterium]|nr:FHA domain-containing protein [Acidobacteriota bacterium]